MINSQHRLDISQFSESLFVERFGGLYEHSPWIARQVWADIQTDQSISVESLASKLKQTVVNGTRKQKMDLLCAHPELAGKAATEGTLTPDSTDEQSRARLDLCSPQEYEKFQRLNSTYNAKFNFPFIMAVRNSSRTEILQAFESRIHNSVTQEFETALEQVHQIALLRLHASIMSDVE